MAKMSDFELLAILNEAEQDAVLFNTEFMADNERLLKRYQGELYGDEVEGRSQVVSTDVADVVEADMPSLMRVFTGSGDIVKFRPNTDSKEDVEEAENKTRYVDWLIRNQPESFKMIHDWVKDAEIQKMGVVKYFIEDTRKVEEHSFTGVDQFELAEITESLRGEDVEKVEIVETFINEGEEVEEGKFNVKFRVTKGRQKVCIINVPTENFLITRGAESLDDAAMVGDCVKKTRSDLIAEGYPEELVKQLPAIDDDLERQSTMKQIRNNDQTTVGDDTISHWASQEVEIKDLYLKVDYDCDGVAEMRHIMFSGNVILENEVFNHRPYAMFSAIMMPHKAIGRSRAEITEQTARVKTVLLRQTLDNIYMVNNGRNVVNDLIDLDDMLTIRAGGVVRSEGEGPVQNNVMPLMTPYIGDKSLQVIQYMDQARAQTTGSLLASQGLDADSLGKETATRFNGVEEASEAKVELIARVMAETGWRKLYEGIAWITSQFQDEETEFRALGKTLKTNPANWRFNHHVETMVGLGAGNNEKLVQSMSALLQVHQQLAANGSPLTDQVKVYNTLDRVVKGLGLPRTEEFFNNPEEPEDLLQAQNEILNNMVVQLQQQMQAMQNPLAEVEQIKAQASLLTAQAKQQTDVAKLAEDQRQFNIKTQQESRQFQQEMIERMTKLELEYNKNIPGSAV